MSSNNTERLYHYLPNIYQQRDQQKNQQLRTLLALLENELRGFEQEVDTAYNNIFIETCESWTIPYIGDLLGILNLHDKNRIILSQRPRIANTLRYRRRKGQLSTLERVINDTTGWRAKVVEFTRQLAITQHIQHLLLSQIAIADIRSLNAMQSLNTAFDKNSHTIDVRDPKLYQAKYNLNIIGLFIWRLQSYPITAGTAYKVKDKSAKVINGLYTFHPLGIKTPLYNRPQVLGDLTQLSKETNLPVAIRPAALADDLQENQQKSFKPTNTDYYGPESAFYLTKIKADGSRTPVPFSEIISMNVKEDGTTVPPAGKIAVDVKTGRIALNTKDQIPSDIEVRYHYAFSAEIGGGHYDRQESVVKGDSTATLVSVAKSNKTNGNGKFNSIKAALEANKTLLTATSGKKRLIIQIEDDATYTDKINEITLGNTATLIIQAKSGFRPCIDLADPLIISADQDDNQLILNGLLLSSGIKLKGKIAIQLKHCTLQPKTATSSIQLETLNTSDVKQLQISIDSCICGAIQLPKDAGSLTIKDSIVDAKSDTATAIGDKDAAKPGPTLNLTRCTVFGKIQAIEAPLISESIITGVVTINRIQTGCIRYSSLPLFKAGSFETSSRTPARYRCQPELTFTPKAEQKATTEGLSGYLKLATSESTKIKTWWNLTLTQLQPQFSSKTYGDPNYGQLSQNVDASISAGAEDGSEMGVFKQLKQPQRKVNLKDILEEFMPLNLSSETFFVN